MVSYFMQDKARIFVQSYTYIFHSYQKVFFFKYFSLDFSLIDQPFENLQKSLIFDQFLVSPLIFKLMQIKAKMILD